MPRQSARLTLVNDVNFLLYTPFLPEAAAGTLEPRHVVTPLREILDRTYLRLGTISGHDPEARTVELRTRDGEVERASLRPAAARARLGLAGAAGARPLRARGRLQNARRRDLAAQPRGRDARGGQRERRSGAPRRAAHLRLRRRRLRRPRGARRAAGLRRRRDGELSARPPARDALGAGRGDRTGCCPRSTPASPSTRCASCAAAASTSGSETTLEEVSADRARLSSGETLPTRTVVWTAGVAPHPSLRQLEPAARRARPRPGRRVTCGCAGRSRSGRSATAPRRPTRAAASARRPPSTPSGRARSRRATSPPSSASAARAPSSTAATPPSSTSAATRRSAGSAAASSAASPPGGWRGPTT